MLYIIIAFIKKWALPLGMISGVLVYLLFHCLSILNPVKPFAEKVGTHLIPILVFTMLFITFCKIAPKKMQIYRWHFVLVTVQLFSCVLIALFLHFFPEFRYKIVMEGVMVCLIAPTATAAAVITGNLGGNESSLTTYTIFSNIAVAVIIPLAFPLVENSEKGTLVQQFVIILQHVFPLLICPFFAAWGLRIFFPKAHVRILQFCSNLAFYLWAISLIIVIGQTLRSLVNSTVETHIQWLLAISGLVVCVLQFAAGKIIGGHYHDRISAGQGLGQKNTVFAIWISYTYLSPVVSVAPSSYILWQNIINSWQLWRIQKKKKKQIL